jgi:hypothetical protein
MNGDIVPLPADPRLQSQPPLRCLEVVGSLRSDHVVNHLLEDLVVYIPKIKKKRKKYRPIVKAVILDLYVSYLEDPVQFVGYSRNKNNYVGTQRYGRLFLSYARIILVVDSLAELRYIHNKLGFYDRTRNRGRQSRMRAEGKLIDLIEGASVTRSMISRIPKAEIILKDAGKRQAEFLDSPDIIVMRENIRKINALLSGADLRLELNQSQQKEYRDAADCLPSLEADTLHRVFNNGSFEQGGRFYGHWIQGAPVKYRRHLKIDGEGATELDYSGFHIRILYRLAGEAAPAGDVYTINGLGREVRPLLKTILLVSINARSQDQAIRAVLQDPTNKSFFRSTYGEIKALMESFLDRHFPIRQFFNSGKGISLQYLDSQVAEKVMLEMVDQGIVCLPIHDSFITKSSHEADLRSAMEKAALSVFDVAIPIDTKY